MKVLILGGNRYVGKRVAKLLLNSGHEVTLFNRGNFDDGLGSGVERIHADKNNLSYHLKNRFFDIVIDQICMNEADATNTLHALHSHTNHYIMTSTLAVYPRRSALSENDFYPLNYKPLKGYTPLEIYSEAKRSAEATLAKISSITWAVARFPIILGDDDPTSRLKDEVQKIKNNQGVFYENTNALFSLIQADDAAKALQFLALHQYTGAFNFASETPIKVSDFLGIIEERTKKKVILNSKVTASPFSIPETWTLDVEKSINLGIKYQKISDWLPKLIS